MAKRKGDHNKQSPKPEFMGVSGITEKQGNAILKNEPVKGVRPDQVRAVKTAAAAATLNKAY